MMSPSCFHILVSNVAWASNSHFIWLVLTQCYNLPLQTENTEHRICGGEVEGGIKWISSLIVKSSIANIHQVCYCLLSFRWSPCSELKLPECADKPSLVGNGIKEDGAGLFSVVSDGTRRNRHKLKYMKFQLNVRKAYLIEGLSNTEAW